MQINSKLYEILKFAQAFGFGVITIVSGLLLAFGIGEHVITLVTMCISSACQLIVLFINICSKNHWKAVNTETGEETEIEPIETEEAE